METTTRTRGADRDDRQVDDELRAMTLAERLHSFSTGSAELEVIELGGSLGLYAALFEAGPVDPGTLAAITGLDAHELCEWLEQQTAAGVLDLVTDSADPWAREFLLPAGHLPVLLNAESPAYLREVAASLAAAGRTLPQLRSARRKP